MPWMQYLSYFSGNVNISYVFKSFLSLPLSCYLLFILVSIFCIGDFTWMSYGPSLLSDHD